MGLDRDATDEVDSAAGGDLRELVRGTVAGLTVRVGNGLLAVLVHLAIARVWGAPALGIYALALAVADTAALVARLGTPAAAVRLVSTEATKNPNAVYRLVLAVSLPSSAILGALVWISAPALSAHLFEKPELVLPIRALAAAVPMINLIQAAAVCFQGMRRVGTAAVLSGLLPPAFALALLAAAAHRGALAPEVPTYVRALAIALAAATAAAAWHRFVRRRPLPTGGIAPPLRRLLRIAWPMFGSSLLLWLLTTTDTFFLGALGDSADVGIYRAAAALALVLSFAPSALHTIAAPKFAAAHWGGDARRLERLVKHSARGAVGTVLAAATVLMVLSRPLLALFGASFVAALPVLWILSLGIVATACCGPAGPLLNMIGKERAMRRALAIAAAVNLVLNLLLVPRWGIVGAAAATAVSSFLANGLAALVASRTVGYWVGVR